jgi:hypothetical protein
MPHFTKEELIELATVFNLKLDDEVLPVRDGYVRKGQMVWWRANTGPEHVKSTGAGHWANIRNYPNAYQLEKPKLKEPNSFAGYAD